MRVYIGTFGEEEIQGVLQDFREMNIRTEIKPFISVDLRGKYFIKGKLDEIKEKYKETELEKLIGEWEDYIRQAREVFKDGMKEREFEREMLRRIMPGKDEMISSLFDSIRDANSEKVKKLEDLMIGMKEEEVKEFFSSFGEAIRILGGLQKIFQINGIKYENEELHGVFPENPKILLYIENVDGEKAEKLGLDFTFDTYIEKQIDIYANLQDLLYEEEKLKEKMEEKPEYLELAVFSDAIAMMMEKLNGKMELEEFFSEVMDMEEENHNIFVSPQAVETIIETLEKMEVVKIKKGKIWLRKNNI